VVLAAAAPAAVLAVVAAEVGDLFRWTRQHRINLDTVTDLEIQETEDKLNNRSRQGECVAEKVPWGKKT
jgi:hypothetical protein